MRFHTRKKKENMQKSFDSDRSQIAKLRSVGESMRGGAGISRAEAACIFRWVDEGNSYYVSFQITGSGLTREQTARICQLEQFVSFHSTLKLARVAPESDTKTFYIRIDGVAPPRDETAEKWK